MTIKVVLAPQYGVPGDESGLAAAMVVAKRFSAHVDVMHVRADPRTMIPYIGEGMSGALIEEMITSAEQQADERAAKVRKQFDLWREKAGLPLKEGPDGKGPSCAWIESVGRPDTAIARRGRVADLVVVCRPDGESAVTTVTEVLEAVLLESGRPLLVAPSQPAKSVGKRVAIAWNGGAEASRAVADAMPFLQTADAVVILAVGESAPPEASGKALADYLGRHEIAVQLRKLEAEQGTSVGATLIAAAGAEKADLMVMGAYTHSRLRELVFGGVTREVLAAADLPVVMAH